MCFYLTAITTVATELLLTSSSDKEYLMNT